MWCRAIVQTLLYTVEIRLIKHGTRVIICVLRFYRY
ncbi:hypothetical protein M080_6416, partial [Bacteroides fragilis str. 3397 T10]